MTNTLSPAEWSQFAELESVIDAGLAALAEAPDVLEPILDMVEALREIESRGYFRTNHDTFEEYYATRIESALDKFSDRHARRLRVFLKLKVKGGPIGPRRESHARELAKAPEEHQQEIMEELVEEGGDVTAKRIEEKVAAWRNGTAADARRIATEERETALRDLDRQLDRQQLRFACRGYQTARQRQDPDRLCAAWEALIDVICEEGGLDRPDLDQRGKKARAAA